jgi:nucleotide-binding universal stress UspA family protein
MGTHGRTGLSRLMMGSVAQKVSARSSVPVMTVHREDGVAHPAG